MPAGRVRLPLPVMVMPPPLQMTNMPSAGMVTVSPALRPLESQREGAASRGTEPKGSAVRGWLVRGVGETVPRQALPPSSVMEPPVTFRVVLLVQLRELEELELSQTPQPDSTSEVPTMLTAPGAVWSRA